MKFLVRNLIYPRPIFHYYLFKHFRGENEADKESLFLILFAKNKGERPKYQVALNYSELIKLVVPTALKKCWKLLTSTESRSGNLRLSMGAGD